MDTLKIISEIKYVPNMAIVPEAFSRCSFSALDFTGKERLKYFLMTYLEDFKFEIGDSLYLHSGDFAFRLFVSIYREISARVSIDEYRFFDWPEYSAKLLSMWNNAEYNLMEDLFGTKFVFIFDYTVSNNDKVKFFAKIVDYCNMHQVKLFVCSRLDAQAAIDSLPPEIAKVFWAKVHRIKINE